MSCFLVFMYLIERAKAKSGNESGVVNNVLIMAFVSTLIVKVAIFVIFFLVGFITG